MSDVPSGAVGLTTTPPVPSSISVEQFLREASQLHQTWIRRFDLQHRKRPRAPDIESDRLRLVRRLQLLQRLQAEDLQPEELGERLSLLTRHPGEARLVEGDTAFLEALLDTWQTSRWPQAASITAGARTPSPSATIEFRW